MKETKFKLLVHCTVGFDDEEEIGEVEVDTFRDLLEHVSCLMNRNKDKELFKDIKSRLEVPSGGEVFSVGHPEGIIAVMKSEDGVSVEIKLCDNSGVSSWYEVNGEKYETESKRQLRKARDLAAQIMKLRED